MRRPTITAATVLLLLVPAMRLRGQAGNDMPHGELALDCGECHVAERWTPVGRPPSFRHESTGFRLESAHARASCRSCHRSLVFSHVGTACLDCHQDAHRGELGTRCEACHTPTTWTNQREMFQAHARTRFPLFVSHARLDCTACHRTQQPYEYKNTPAECGSCHLPTYLATRNPDHVASGFSRRCEDCHNIASPTWQGAVSGHPARFPLEGGHAGVACRRCHEGGDYAGTSPQCVSCHQQDYARTTNPNHAASRLPTECQACHGTSAWRPASFDHDGRYFPIYSGTHRGRWSSCSECHLNPSNYRQFECILCHEHSNRSELDKEHRGVNGYVYASSACYTCHRNGRADSAGPPRRLQ